MGTIGMDHANATLADRWALNAGKESLQGPGPCPTVHTHQWIRGGRSLRIAKLGVKGADTHPEVLWIVGETGTSIAIEAVGAQRALARAGIEVRSSETGNP